MRKIQKDNTYKLPCLTIYFSQISEIYELYQQSYDIETRVTLKDGTEYVLESVGELENSKVKDLRMYISVKGEGRYSYYRVHVSLDESYGRIVFPDDSTELKGVALCVRDIFSRHQQKVLNFLKRDLMALVLGPSFLVFTLVEWGTLSFYGAKILLFTYFASFVFLVFVAFFYKNNTFSFSSLEPSFFVRNKDDLIKIVIAAIIGALIMKLFG